MIREYLISYNDCSFERIESCNELLSCAIGDEFVDGKPYSEIVDLARHFIKNIGGFEKFAEWGLF